MKKLWLIIFTLVLAGCSSYQISESPTFVTQQAWVIMPMTNNSRTPLAAESAEQILSSLLFSRGISPLRYPTTEVEDLASILDDFSRQKKAQKWLKSQPAKYVITGSIEEWQYKSGLDGEPAVGVTLEIIDIQSNQILWKASGSRAGWGRESLSATAQIVIQELIDDLDLDGK